MGEISLSELGALFRYVFTCTGVAEIIRSATEAKPGEGRQVSAEEGAMLEKGACLLRELAAGALFVEGRDEASFQPSVHTFHVLHRAYSALEQLRALQKEKSVAQAMGRIADELDSLAQGKRNVSDPNSTPYLADFFEAVAHHLVRDLESHYERSQTQALLIPTEAGSLL